MGFRLPIVDWPSITNRKHLHCDRQGEQAQVSDAKRAHSSYLKVLGLAPIVPAASDRGNSVRTTLSGAARVVSAGPAAELE